MKRFHACLTLSLLVASSATTAAESWSLNAFKSRVLPVLVQVDSAGKITSVSPATELTPKFDRLLRASLDEMIHQPAMEKGRAMASQFVINLALEVSPRDGGNYDARFAYVSAKPVPNGSWYWSHEDGHRLALVNRNGLQQRWHNPASVMRNSTLRYYTPPRDMNAMPSGPTQTASRSSATSGKKG